MSLSEMIFLGLLGLVVFGPRKLVHLGQQLGQTLAAFKKATGDFSTQLSSDLNSAEQPLVRPGVNGLLQKSGPS